MVRLRLYILGKNTPEITCASQCLILGTQDVSVTVQLEHLGKVVPARFLPCNYFFPFVINTYCEKVICPISKDTKHLYSKDTRPVSYHNFTY